jgi:putative chitinase
MILTTAQLRNALDIPNKRAELWIDPINMTLERFKITEPIHIAAFLAQAGHESAQLSMVEENLNYSSNGLRSVFSKYFTIDQADEYAREPEKIANRVYANRMGNGDEASGDGWRYRGKGLIQITGKHNHEKCGQALGLDLIAHPELLLETINAALSAGWFWYSRGLNGLAGDIRAVTKVVNGGTNGLDDRQRLFKLSKMALGVA